MFTSTSALLWHKSKRIVVKLMSAAQTGFYYVTEKSSSKRDMRMALRKHDPVVNRHVMFYELKGLVSSQKQKLMRKRSLRNMRFTGDRVEQLVKQLGSRSARSVGILYLCSPLVFISWTLSQVYVCAPTTPESTIRLVGVWTRRAHYFVFG